MPVGAVVPLYEELARTWRFRVRCSFLPTPSQDLAHFALEGPTLGEKDFVSLEQCLVLKVPTKGIG